MLGRGFADVAADRRAVGDGLGRFPRLEAIAERVHVGIRTDAGIAEQIPGAADSVAAFQDGIGFVRAILLQMNRRANARQAGANNQNVEISGTHGTRLPLRERKARAGLRQWGKTARAATNRHRPAAAGYRRGAPGIDSFTGAERRAGAATAAGDPCAASAPDRRPGNDHCNRGSRRWTGGRRNGNPRLPDGRSATCTPFRLIRAGWCGCACRPC